MHGKITSYDSRKGQGWIQGDDGHIYDFKYQDLLKAEEESMLRTDMQVDFQPSDQPNADGKKQALELALSNPEEFADNVFYKEPENMPIYNEDFVDGYDILDRGIYRIQRRDRSEDKALYRLRYDCQQVKANAIVGYKVTTELKNAFGNGYNLYVASGVPVVIGKASADGDCTAKDLKHRLDQAKIKKMHNVIVNTKIGMMVVKVLGAILLLVFAIGFFMSGGV